MAVSYFDVAAGNSESATRTSFDTALPAGWAAGDVAVLVGHVSGTNLTMDPGAGWTEVPGSWPVNQGSNSRMYVWWRVLQSGDTAPTISNSGSVTGGWELVVLRGAASVVQASTAVVSASSLTLPTLSGVGAGSALFVAAHARVASGTIPTNLTFDGVYTEVVDHATSRNTGSANVRAAVGYRLLGAGGSYGGESVTSTGSASMVGVLVEVSAASVDATVAPDGVAAPVDLGVPSVDGTLTTAADGVAVPTSVGSPAVDGSLGVAAGGVSLPVAAGSPGVSWSLSAAPDGLPSPVAVGVPAVGWSAAATPDGLVVPAAAGAPSVGWSVQVGPDGVAVPTAVGGPVLLGAVLSPDGLGLPVQVGGPSAGWAGEVAPDGAEVPVLVGAAGTSVPGRQVSRPYTGTVARPAGVVVRPSVGVVSRP
ncbi:hypothetical protein ACN27B_08695 [Micromonospora sp. WMMD754]|uniref:hypothetical protein n=1 Tax=Micromonospora sp. WMMD754 TaxID=3404114 RepID=UPI003BF4EA43